MSILSDISYSNGERVFIVPGVRNLTSTKKIRNLDIVRISVEELEYRRSILCHRFKVAERTETRKPLVVMNV